MNRDDITYDIPSYENAADRYAMDDSPVRLGETGAGLGWGDTPEMLNDADRRHLAAVNAFRAKKGWTLIAESEYLAYMETEAEACKVANSLWAEMGI